MDILLLMAVVIVLAMAVAVAVMLWQSHRSRRLLERRHEVIEREQRKVKKLEEEARRRGIDPDLSAARAKQQTIKLSK